MDLFNRTPRNGFKPVTGIAGSPVLAEEVEKTLSEKKQWLPAEVVFLSGPYYLRENHGLIDLHSSVSPRRMSVAILHPLQGWVAIAKTRQSVTRFEMALRR